MAGDTSLSSIFNNPWVSIPYGLTTGVLSAASPAVGRGIYGLNSGLNFALAAEKRAADEERKKKLGQALGGIWGATAPQTTTQNVPSQVYAPDTSPIMPGGQPHIPSEASLGEILGKIPTVPMTTTEQKPIFSPGVQAAGKALSQYAPETAAALALRSVLQAPPRKQYPPAPQFATQGGEGIQTQVNPATGQWETTRQPLTPAPAREPAPMNPLQTENIKSQIAERTARMKRLDEAAKAAKDPKVTQEKLTTMYNGLLRDREQMDKALNDEAVAVIDAILSDVRDRLAVIVEQKGSSKKAKQRIRFNAQGIRVQ